MAGPCLLANWKIRILIFGKGCAARAFSPGGFFVTSGAIITGVE